LLLITFLASLSAVVRMLYVHWRREASACELMAYDPRMLSFLVVAEDTAVCR